MNGDRPKIEVPLEPIDWIADLAALALLLLLVIYTAIQVQDLPETIPVHFNFKGEADGFGNKHTMWWLPGIGLLIAVLFFVLARFPHRHNYMVNITETNALKNYRFSNRILRGVLVLMMLLFLYIQHTVVSYVNHESPVFGNGFFAVVTGALLIFPIGAVIYQYRMNKH